jgi:hypothetical protein
MSGTENREFFMGAGVARRIARRLGYLLHTDGQQKMSGIGNERENLQARVSWRFVRKPKEDTFIPQMGSRTCQR